MATDRRSSVSKAKSLEGVGEYWDSHDLTDADVGGPDVDLEVACAVPIEEELYSSLEEEAGTRGVRVETLVNLWLQQKLAESRATASQQGSGR